MLDPLQFYCRILCNGMKTRFRMVMIAHPGPGIGFHKRFMWQIIIPPTPDHYILPHITQRIQAASAFQAGPHFISYPGAVPTLSRLHRLQCPQPPQPGPIIINDQEEYEVEEVLDSRSRWGRLWYLVKFIGWSHSDNMWLPHSEVHAPAVVEEFHL